MGRSAQLISRSYRGDVGENCNFYSLLALRALLDIFIIIWVQCNWRALSFCNSHEHSIRTSVLIHSAALPTIQFQLIPDKKDLIKGELSYCVNDDHLMASPQCLWDFVVILSLLKFLQLPLFFKYLINYLEHHNRSNYLIKIVRVIWECRISLKSASKIFPCRTSWRSFSSSIWWSASSSSLSAPLPPTFNHKNIGIWWKIHRSGRTRAIVSWIRRATGCSIM